MTYESRPRTASEFHVHLLVRVDCSAVNAVIQNKSNWRNEMHAWLLAIMMFIFPRPCVTRITMCTINGEQIKCICSGPRGNRACTQWVAETLAAAADPLTNSMTSPCSYVGITPWRNERTKGKKQAEFCFMKYFVIIIILYIIYSAFLWNIYEQNIYILHFCYDNGQNIEIRVFCLFLCSCKSWIYHINVMASMTPNPQRYFYSSTLIYMW